jgi:hypothetical protein
MDIKDIKLYTIQVKWNEFDGELLLYRTVAVGKPDFLNEEYSWDWTDEQKDFDDQVFYYYEDYAELNQHLKDGDETHHDFIVTKIINQ